MCLKHDFRFIVRRRNDLVSSFQRRDRDLSQCTRYRVSDSFDIFKQLLAKDLRDLYCRSKLVSLMFSQYFIFSIANLNKRRSVVDDAAQTSRTSDLFDYSCALVDSARLSHFV